MKHSRSTAFYLVISLTRALPAPAPQGVPSPVDPSQVQNQPIPPVASGSLRGSESLLGYTSSDPISTESTAIPPDDFDVAPGQSEDADLGLYIDLSNVRNPQPIRGGTKGPTEPGPRSVNQYHSSGLTHVVLIQQVGPKYTTV